MNEFILFVMDDLANPSKYTQEQKEANRESAYTTSRHAANAAAAAADAADASDAAYAAYAADTAAAASDADTDYWINRYFERTGEDKQLYVNEIERINNMTTMTCNTTDAVNEFKGEWESGRALIYKVKATGDLNFSNFIQFDNQDSCGYACNKDEFEARVFYMTLNFGESSLKRLRIWQEGIKRQPESDEQHTDKLNERPKPVQPVFTQAMADNGELPQVGMECLIKLHHQGDTQFNKGYINGYSQDGEWLIFTDFLGNLKQHNINNGIYRFKPIDTRSNKEKAIDDIRLSCGFNKINAMESELLSKAYDKWVGE